MKKSIAVLFISIFFCLAAFSQHPQKIVLKTTAPEDFSIFQSRFFSDSSYQLSRIKFPLNFLEPDNSPFQLVQGQWRFSEHLHWSKTNPSDVHFKLIEVLNADRDKVVYGKHDNGDYENYTFSLVDGKWFLVKVEIPEL